MANYLIHACEQRNWYVEKYLIPSMIEQGIDRDNIKVYLDKDKGCLEACMDSFLNLPNYGETWHLQDDVIICHDFKTRTEHYSKYDCGIVCGYAYELDDSSKYKGKVPVYQMWYSFPCIKIPNFIAKMCAEWFYKEGKYDSEYRMWVKSKKYDDAFFKAYMLNEFPYDVTIKNLVPNLVDHIDYLIGGSIINRIRCEKETHAKYFEDTYLVEELEKKLINNS